MAAWLAVLVAPLILAAQMPLPVIGHGGTLATGHGGPQGKVTPPSDAPHAPAAPSSSAPGRVNPSAPAGPAASAPPPRHEPVIATGGADLEALTGGEEVEDWWIWWEINKSLYLVSPDVALVEPVAPWRLPTTAPEAPSARHARLGRALLPLLRTALGDDAAPVRAAAATTLGRLGGEDAVDALLPLLRDPSLDVREAALLALGATGSPRAVSTLLAVASDGRVPGGNEQLAPSAGPLALVAVAVARRHGLDDAVDPLVAALVEVSGPELREAGLLYDALAGTNACSALVHGLAADGRLDIRLRCRITEALPACDLSLLPDAIRELESDNPDRRRAAAVTLAGVPGGSVLTELESALASEKEPLTRGLLLLSVGAHGGDAARGLLQRQLLRCRPVDRPWVALALGLLARAGDDDLARAALRDGLRDESSAQSRGAWILACGLARDAQAGPALRAALTDASNPRDRLFAALALSMVRDEASLGALRAALDVERSPLARSGLVLGLALFRRAEDAPRLLAELRGANDPSLQSQFACALGFNDSAAAVDGLQQLAAKSEGLPAAARAATIEALGMLLDDHAGLQLVHAATGRNFAVFPDWLARALVTTSL